MKQKYFKYLNVVNQTNQYQYNAEANNETPNQRDITESAPSLSCYLNDLQLRVRMGGKHEA